MADSTKPLAKGEIGKSGTTISSGVISGEDYNFKLTGQNALRVYDQMRRSDATVRAAMTAFKQPIKNANYKVDPASDSELDQKVAELVNQCLFVEVDWKKFINEALTYLDFGFSLLEKVYEPKDFNGQRYIMLTKFGYRKQTTIEKWEMEGGGEGVTQRVAEGHAFSIPIAKLVRFTNEQEGDNYEGISFYRSSYKNWYIKQNLEKVDAVGHEKHALGVLDITYPKGTDDKTIKAARRAAKNMRANQQSYVDHNEGIKFEFMNMQANSLRDMMPSINYHNRQILLNLLTQFLELGAAGGSGSRAVSEDHSRLLEQGVQAVAEHIVKVIQDYVIKQLVDLNFTNVTDYPQLRVDKISDENIPVISEAFKKFVEAGALHPRPEDENSVRRILGLAEVEETELEAVYETSSTTDDTADDEKAAADLKATKKLHASLEARFYGRTAA